MTSPRPIGKILIINNLSLMNLDDKQREKLLELKKFSQQNKQTYTKIVKNLLKIKNQIFEELNKTNSMVNSIRNSLSDVQIAKFLF